MASIINAATSGGLITTADTSGILNLQTAGTTAITIDGSQNVGVGVTPSAWGTTYKAQQIGQAGVLAGHTAVPAFTLASNAYENSGWKAITTNPAHRIDLSSDNNATIFYRAASVTAGNALSWAESMRLDSSGNLGVGITSPLAGYRGHFVDTRAADSVAVGVRNLSSSGITRFVLGNDIGYARFTIGYNGSTFASRPSTAWLGTEGTESLWFKTNDTARLWITSAGYIGVNTSTPETNGAFCIRRGVTTSAMTNCSFSTSDAANSTFDVGHPSANLVALSAQGSSLALWAGSAERARIDSAGHAFFSGNYSVLYPGSGNTTTGIFLESAGQFCASRDNTVVARFNRNSTDGTLLSFSRQGTEIGTVSVSGGVVSYNAFAGSHWSQLSDGSKPDIVRGTVLESINELVQWPNEPTTERLCKVKVSDTAGSKKVYGVFMDWDNDWTATNDMYVTAVGAFVCRVNASVTVQEGDLLESNGDGTARVQADDLIRSSTIGKVTCTEKTQQYDDGSYCVPTVLYCG